jgi:hypothetical protein
MLLAVSPKRKLTLANTVNLVELFCSFLLVFGSTSSLAEMQ